MLHILFEHYIRHTCTAGFALTLLVSDLYENNKLTITLKTSTHGMFHFNAYYSQNTLICVDVNV